MDRLKRIAGGTILVGTLVLALKTAAWWLTGSAALYADALQSLLDLAASLIALGVATRTHPHHKAGLVAAIIQGVLTIAAALSILQHAWSSWTLPTPIDAPWLALGLNLAATLLNAGWALLLLRAGRPLETSAITSFAVPAGLLVALQTGTPWLDPAIAAALALPILWSGLHHVHHAIGSLIDQPPAAQVIDRIRDIVGQHADGAIEAHDLRTRHAGRLTYLEFHLVVPGHMRVDEAHLICDRVEAALKAEVEGLVITIHVEPEAKAKHSGVLVL